MGPLLSPPQLPPGKLMSGHRVYASFCSRVPEPGSNMSNWIEYYNPSDNSWNCVGTIPGLAENHVLKDFAMVAIRSSIYVIGGRLCRKDGGGSGGSDVVEEDLAVLSNVLRYDVISDEWCQCAPLGTPRFDFACTILDDKIYAVGGQCTLASARGISSAEVYEPSLDKWTALPNMSTLRYKCVGVAWQEKIYVVGGFAEKEDCFRTVPFHMERSSAEVFDPIRGEWDLMLGMWQLDVPPNQIVAVGDRLYSSGDCLNTWKGHIEAYDGKLNIWKVIEGSCSRDLSHSTEPMGQRVYLTMVPIGTQLCFFAGYRLPGELFRFMSTVHSFDTLATWRSFEPKEEKRDKELCCHGCVVQVS